MLKVLISGASGFIARHLVRRLKGDGVTCVMGVIRKGSLDCPPWDDYFVADLSEAQPCLENLRQFQPDWIFHLAGKFKGTDEELYTANLMTGVRLLAAVQAHASRAKVIVVGSAAEYGLGSRMDGFVIREDTPCLPGNGYGLSKYALTQYALYLAKHRRLAINVVRPFNVVGQGIAPSLLVGAVLERAQQALREGRDWVTVGNVTTTRDFIAVEDAVRGLIAVAKSDQQGQIFNLCSGRGVLIEDMVRTVLSCAPRPISFRVDPALLSNHDPHLVLGDPSKARDVLKFEAVVDPIECARTAAKEVFEGL